MSKKPKIIEKDGEKQVVLPYDEFVAIKEELEDYQDLKALRKAKASSRDEPTVPLSEARDELLED